MELPDLNIIFIPIAILLCIFEWLWLSRRRKESYSGAEVKSNLLLYVGNTMVGIACLGAFVASTEWFYEHRLFSFEASVTTFIALFFIEDFVMYTSHRLKHQVRYFWAVDHVVHHSSPEFNFFTAIRTAWFSPLSFSWILWGGLSLLGFPPELVAFQAALSNIYQFFTHTRLVDKLWAPIEFIFVTPSHHRVHHARNAIYIDKNYGGILIIWDRLLGTFQEELKEHPVGFGINSPVKLESLLDVNFGALTKLFKGLRESRGVLDVIGSFLMPPDWLMPHQRVAKDKVQNKSEQEIVNS